MMKNDGVVICPHCGCKGVRVAHVRKMDQKKAMEHGWKDMRCGACGRVFKSYRWPVCGGN